MENATRVVRCARSQQPAEKEWQRLCGVSGVGRREPLVRSPALVSDLTVAPSWDVVLGHANDRAIGVQVFC